MVVNEYPYKDENGVTHANLIKHYSDEGKYIIQLQTGIEYAEAVDVVPCRYTYVESDRSIEESESEEVADE